MKFTKFFRVLTLAAIVSLLLLAIPASPALAAESVTVYPEEGEIGDSVDIDGDDFTETEEVGDPPELVNKSVDIYLSREDGGIDDIDNLDNYEFWTDSVGTNDEFSRTITIPSELRDGDEDEEVTVGTYYIYVTYEGEDDVQDYAEFTVIAPEITLSPTHGVVGAEVEITGDYFSGGEDISVDFGAHDMTDEIEGDNATDSGGGFECSILIPLSTAGTHTIAVEDESNHTAEATFTVESDITISADDGKEGDTVAVTGTGFGDEVVVDVMLDSRVVGSGETNDEGSFTIGFEVPDDVAEGSYDVTAEDEDGNEDSVAFAIYIATEVSISPVTTQASAGHVGTDITVSGVGFTPEHEITITYATEPTVVKTVTSDADGAFTAAFKAPKSNSGAHTITASDGTNSLTMTFYMESTPPPAPEPLLPETDVKTASPVHFDWGDVPDASLPVTYTLQVAIDDDFTTASIVLEKKDLTGSEYTLTEAEKLEPRAKETPYYWRVKAIDSASNASAWSTPKSFYTGGGFGFALPSWQIHLWWGIGVAAAIAFGYWVGKRRAAASY